MRSSFPRMAPEALKAGYDKKADVFSFGVVMYVEAAHAVSVFSFHTRRERTKII